VPEFPNAINLIILATVAFSAQIVKMKRIRRC
jgi:hypothetical protein